MVEYISKRLQVFVSSTYSDLRAERQAAVEAILVAGHIPAGMELFTSGDESQMEVINRWIDESDVFLLILGGRYGSIEPRSGKSYTQLEYEYAVAKNKPLFACVIKETAIESRVREFGLQVIETDEQAKLRAFRFQVLSRMVRFWEDYKDIKITIGETLANFSRREELQGWIRASSHVDITGLVDEIARLSAENSRLRELSSTGVKIYKHWQAKEVQAIIASAKESITIVDSWYAEAPSLGGLIENQIGRESRKLKVTVYMLAPELPFGAQRRAEFDGQFDGQSSDWGEKYRSKLTDATESLERHIKDIKGAELNIFHYRIMPALRLFVIDDKEYIFSWFPMNSPSADIACVHLSLHSASENTIRAIEKLRFQLNEIHKTVAQ